MKKQSIWLEGISSKTSPSLKKGLTTDILIIGGGMAGISTAFALRNKNQNVILIDKGQVGHGISAHTTGKLTFLQELVYQKLEANFGPDITDLYLASQKEAIETVKKNVVDHHIDCNFEGVESYVFANDFKEQNMFQKEEKILTRNKIPYTIHTKVNGMNVPYAIAVEDTAVFHPVKYIQELKRICEKDGIPIYENTSALDIQKETNGYKVITEEGYIRCKKVVICTHYPFFTLPGFFPLRTHIERSYLAAGEIKNKKKLSAITCSAPTKSFRFHEDKKNYLLYVGNSHKLGNKLDYEKNYQEHINTASSYLKDIDYIWQNHDIMTNDGLPFIGKIKKDDDTLLIATGFNTWGMTNGVIAGKVLSDILTEQKNPYIALFAPYRGMSFDQIKNFTIDAFHTSKTYVLSHLKNYYSFYLNEVKISSQQGKKVGIYIDENNKYHIVRRTCPHLKCALTFNMFMKTWDCPCHGSRFDIDGNCIEGPSLYHIKL